MKRLLVLAALIVACQAPPPLATPSPTPAVTRGGTLVMADYEWPATLDPRLANTAAELRLTGLLYEPLWSFDAELRPVPRLLAAMPRPQGHPDGPWTLDLRLRPGLRWSDGSPLTADDVMAAAAGIKFLPQQRKSATEVVWDITSYLKTWRSLGPQVVPQRPNAVSGPFEVAGQVPGSEIELRANPYASPRPYLDAITFRAYLSKAAETAGIHDGHVDLGFHLLPSDVSQLAGHGRSVTAPTLRYELLVTNHLADLPVDRTALNKAVFDGTAVPAEGPPATQSVRGLTFSLLAVCDDQVRQLEQTELVRQWTALGAKVTADCEPRATYFARLARGDFQAALFSDDFPPDTSGWTPPAGQQLYRWPETVQVTSRLHGFAINPVAGMDTSDAAGWWLSTSS